jgi:mannan endo-1,4-beta-mannosidase
MGGMDRRRFLMAAGAVLATAGCTSTPPIPSATPAPPPVYPGHHNPDVRKLIAWLSSLPQRDANRVVSGQQIQFGGYEQFVNGLARRTGRRPAMIGAGFDGYWNPRMVRVLIDHWGAGGLVTMDLHPPNPFLDGADPESYRVTATDPKPDLRELLAGAPASPQRDRWRAELERLGDVLQELAESGVVVIFRPLHEQNGTWFWWGEDVTTRQTAVRELYQDMHAYLSGDRKLHNIIWGHSPGMPWDAPRMKYYPGDEYVDMIGATCYSDDIRLGLTDQPDNLADMTAPQRPVGLLEIGPSTQHDGSWDASLIIDRIRDRYPEMVMFNCWNGWTNVTMELVHVRNAEKLMNDPWVISLETMDWRA